MASDDELFDDVLNLEERFHREGYELGYRDGAEAGRVEGRSVGLKQGYQKFLEAGRLQGRAIVWANRIPTLRRSASSQSQAPSQAQSQTGEADRQPSTAATSTPAASSSSHDDRPPVEAATGEIPRLPDLSAASARLEKNVVTLYGMLEPGTLSTRNDDDAVNDFDSRLKGARGKSKVIERVVGERVPAAGSDDLGGPGAGAGVGAGPRNENIEDVGPMRQQPQPSSPRQ